MPDITKDKYDFAKVLKQTEMVRVDVGLPREVLIPWEDLPKVKSLWPQTGDYVLVTLRIDRENQMFARLASETIVEKCLHLYMMMKNRMNLLKLDHIDY